MPGTEAPGPKLGELARLLLLVGASLWLSSAYFAPRLVGTPDALWYHNLLADAVVQFRAGVFPVFVGQSQFGFNGSVYPLRASPYHQYLAGLLDLLTGRQLGYFALQHLTLILSLVAGALVTYWALAWVAPRRRWTAAGLALLYVMCPGVAGLFYSQYLYMSAMTLPWVPLTFAALVRCFDDATLPPMAVLAAGLAALWWAHSPIAMWASLVCIAGLSALLVARRRDVAVLRRACAAGAIFAALAAYPIVSVLLLRERGENIVPYVMDRSLLMRWIGESFPSSVLPVDAAQPGLYHLQLGYSLWILLIGVLALWRAARRLPAVLALSWSSVLLLLLVFPVPALTRAIWNWIPEPLVGITLYWPMQRLYILAAAATVVCAQRLLAERAEPGPSAVLGLRIGFALAVAWSALEASKLVRYGRSHSETTLRSSLWSLPENIAVQRHTYGLFPQRPAYFSHGVLEPRLESRLLDPGDGRLAASDYSPGAARPGGEFVGSVDTNGGIVDLRPSITLEPGREYLLTFAFARDDLSGVLQMTGERFYREYLLPSSGEAKSFGSGPGNCRSIAVWTSLPSAETISLRFIPINGGAKALAAPFASFSLEPIDWEALPVRVESLIPYRAAVRGQKPAMLETPRMYVPGYEATVNGLPTPVRRSAEGLVEFPVPEGASRVELRYPGPLLLRAAFWLSSAGWLCAALCLAAGAACAFRCPGA